MNNAEVSWVFEVNVHPESLAEFATMVIEVSAADQQAEPGSLELGCFINGLNVHFYEKFQDSAAAAFHLQRFVDNYAARLFSLCTPVSVTVYGNPSEEVRAALAGFSPQYLSTLGGYTRR